jgi:hypothetical protein
MTPNESAIRRKAARAGYRLHKSRERKYVPHAWNHGEFMLIEIQGNFPVLGSTYDATLEDIAEYLSDDAAVAA